MPLIPNYISRLRTHSQSTVATGSSTNTNTESRSASTLEPPLTEASTVGATTLDTIEELERKIHPDPTVLAAETVAELSALEPTGPVPPRRKAKSVPHLKEQGQQMGGEFKNGQADRPSPPKAPLLARILATRSQPVLSPNSDKDEADPPNWATFGRKGVPIISRISEFGSSHRRESSSKSSSTKTPKRRSVPPSSPSSSSVPHVPSQPSSSPAGTVSSSSGSKAYSQQSHSVRSRRHPLNYPDPIPDIESSFQPSPSRSTLADRTFNPRTPPSKSFPDGAPNTFGRGSKRPIVTDGEEVHDDGAAVLFTPTRTSTPPPPERLVRREPPNTYPQRSRKRSMPRGRSVSLPRRLEHIFRKDDPLSELDLGSTRDGAGIVMGQGTSWPEGSTREMVRLSRGEGGDVQSGSAVVGNPSFFGSIGRDRHAFLRAAQRAPQRKAIPSHLAATPRSSPALAKSAGGSESGTLTSTTLFPRASVSKPLSTTVGLSAMSDPGPALSESGFGSLYAMDLTGPVKRKMLDSQDDITMQGSSLGGTRGILLNSNRESSRPSDASHAPSSFRRPKRIRLSTPAVSGSSSPPMHTRSLSPSHPHSSYPSPPHSPTPRPPSSLRSFSSQASSLPVRAIVSPKPPSIVSRHSSYHMRDPALPPRKRESTQWTGAARKVLEVDSNGQRMFPLQAWAFMLGFLFFPVWWIAAVVPIRWGWAWRRGRGKQSGKGTSEDGAVRETLEYDVAYTWRQRCRIISLLGLFVYIPLIVLLAVFVPKA